MASNLDVGDIIPTSNTGDEKPGTAYRRLKFELFERVGSAAVTAV